MPCTDNVSDDVGIVRDCKKRGRKQKLSKQQEIVEKFVVNLAIIVSVMILATMAWLVIEVEFLM